MASLVQKERVLKLRGLDPKELVFETFEVGSEKLKGSFPRFTTNGNPFSPLNIFYLEQGEQDPYGRNGI